MAPPCGCADDIKTYGGGGAASEFVSRWNISILKSIQVSNGLLETHADTLTILSTKVFWLKYKQDSGHERWTPNLKRQRDGTRVEALRKTSSHYQVRSVFCTTCVLHFKSGLTHVHCQHHHRHHLRQHQKITVFTLLYKGCNVIPNYTKSINYKVLFLHINNIKSAPSTRITREGTVHWTAPCGCGEEHRTFPFRRCTWSKGPFTGAETWSLNKLIHK